jgi:hypothetical protein
MKKSTTLKHKKGVQTIPQLRKSFDHMEQFTKSLVHSEKDKSKQVASFQKEWKKVFYHDIDATAAQGFIDFQSKQKQSTRKNKKGKKQSGGQVPLTGSSLDLQTRPGSYETPYGNFPEYIGSGFSFYNKINQDSFFPTQCGKEDSTPTVYTSTGSNKVGGSRKRNKKQRGGFPTLSEFSQALSFGPLSPSTPTSSAYDLQSATKAQLPPASPSAHTGTPPYINYTPQAVSYPSYAINRQLTSEIAGSTV